VAGEAVEVEWDFGREKYVEDVARDVAFGAAGGDFDDVGAVFEDAFGDEESGREFFIVAGGAHGDGDGLAADADFERLFEGDLVGFRCGF